MLSVLPPVCHYKLGSAVEAQSIPFLSPLPHLNPPPPKPPPPPPGGGDGIASDVLPPVSHSFLLQLFVFKIAAYLFYLFIWQICSYEFE